MSQAQAVDRAPAPENRLDVESISVTFGRNRVLRDVSLDVRPGEIHGLIGQNGSGKSTLAKVLTGLYRPDPGGRVAVDGVPLKLPVSPNESMARGVAVVHQSLGLVDDMTVLENLRVGRFSATRLGRRIRWRHEREQARAVFDRLGRRVPLEAPVGSLSEEERATVAIARALQDAQAGGGLIIFDESTRALTRRSLEHFFQMLDEIVKTGTSVLMITHRLEEVVDAADRVTVLRDGQSIESGREVAGLSEADLTRLMLGRNLVDLGGASRDERAGGDPVHVSGLTGGPLSGLGFAIEAGEILGVTGTPDSGYAEIPYLITGAQQAVAGTLTIGDTQLALPKLNPQKAIAHRIALVPEGRERAGLALDLTVAENALVLRSAASNTPLLPLPAREGRATVEEWLERLDVRPRTPQAPVGTFSGGNQQKVVLAKWLSSSPRLLVLHEPTQAVDVGARHIIITAIRQAAAAGCTVLVAGSDENELSLLCDRVLVVGEGGISAELTGEISADDIVNATFASGSRMKLRHGSEHA
ncbi:sugar ABC transporter ATP-binding protein [Gryllotalpicola ginsengisoli]|uniref:sugar ABC transporter ATP-binding protein n=1 Tax=Gryllotalpicola ginsengisoli TaxID=444608 RepID=UPI0003B49B91|nr:sugar ABC transporter ATP-binding protein [Gryllotalpicola ginsengisoli]